MASHRHRAHSGWSLHWPSTGHTPARITDSPLRTTFPWGCVPRDEAQVSDESRSAGYGQHGSEIGADSGRGHRLLRR
jgi:hypothetical protein